MSLCAADLSYRAGTNTILRKVTLPEITGGMTGVIGPNGAGKTTLLKLLAGLLRPASGEVSWCGSPLNEIPAPQRARSLAYIPQARTIHWGISVGALVEMGRLPFRRTPGALSPECRNIVQDAMRAMGVEHLVQRDATTLSGGERARVLVARALAQTPEVLLADEPTSGLDPAHQLRLLGHFKSMAERGICVIPILHDLHLAARYCDRLVILNQGRVHSDGAPLSVLTKQTLLDVFEFHAHIGKIQDVPAIIPLAVAGGPS